MPYYQNEWVTQYCGDALKVLPELPSDSVDLLATDPPYGIGFMGKDWDKFNEIVDPQGAYAKKKGFKKLPRQNTASMTEFFVPIWKECLRVLKAGSFAFVMCSPRADVMAKQICCLQDAGFWVNFTPIFWAYASGFPKAQNIGKAVDKRLGAEREVIGKRDGTYADIRRDTETGQDGLHGGVAIDRPRIESFITAPETPQAKALDGSYGGFQPKPAVEVIIVAMKPLSEKTFVDQALKNRKGITWLDDGRIPYESKDNIIAKNPHTHRENSRQYTEIYGEYQPSSYELPTGRFPANLLVSDDVLNDGMSHSGGYFPEERGKTAFFGLNKAHSHRVGKVGDSGSFSRYFDLDKWAQKTFPFLIVPKASKSEKNRGLGDIEPQQVTDGRNIPPDYPSQRGQTQRHNPHPTVKPLKLMSYLITLGSREGDTVLDPFSGSGTTPVACQLLNRYCTAIEIKEKYCEISVNRCQQTVMDLSKYSS